MILWQRAFSAIISSSKNVHNVITTPKISRNNKPKGKPKPFDQPSSPYNTILLLRDHNRYIK